MSQNYIKEWHLGVSKSPKQPPDTLCMPTSCYGGMQAKKPFLNNTHKCKCLEFANQHWDFNWDPVLWLDETKFDLFGNKHSKWVWHKTKDEYAENGSSVTNSRFSHDLSPQTSTQSKTCGAS